MTSWILAGQIIGVRVALVPASGHKTLGSQPVMLLIGADVFDGNGQDLAAIDDVRPLAETLERASFLRLTRYIGG